MITDKREFLKRFLTFIMSFAIVLGYAQLPSFAATLDASLTVKNVEDGASVVGYQIVKEKDGKWVKADDDIPDFSDVKKPTAAEVQAIAGNATLLAKLHKVTFTRQGANYVVNGPAAGTYLVLVKPGVNDKHVYNPMIVSADYTPDNPGQGSSSVDAADKYFNTAYAKKSLPGVQKTIEDKTNNPDVTGDDTKKGDTHKIGDTVNFKIATAIPNYSKDYDNDKLKFEISDTLSDGLTLVQDSVKVYNGAVKVDESNYVITKSDRGFTIKFKRAYLVDGSDKSKINVKYSAKLNSNAQTGFDPNTNTAKIEYSTSPGGTYNSEKGKTFHYTFDINGNVSGKYSKEVREIVKVGVDANTGELITEEKLVGGHSGKDPKAGAKFKLFKKKAGYTKGSEYIADNSLLIGEAVTDNKGRMKFTGLDAGKYVLVETQAPQGYAKNDTPVDVNISATLNADGTLKSYSISIAGKITETYTVVYNSQKEVTRVDKTGEVGEFNNYKLGTLPSTGGIGTYLFYIVGAVLVVLAGSMLVRHRKKDRTHHDENSH